MKKSVPISAMRMTAGTIEVSTVNGDNAKSAPLTLQALGGEPFQSWYWGKCIQDLSGMKMKARIPVDYEHCCPIGYINKSDTSKGVLTLSGALTPVTDEAKDCMALMQAGVPFESSIDWTPSMPGDLVTEFIPEGMTSSVNGKEYDGPLYVFRKWPLRSVAIVKSGADSNTEATLQAAASKDKQIEIDVTEMTKPEDKTDTATTQPTQQSAVDITLNVKTDDKTPVGEVVVKVESQATENVVVETEPVETAMDSTTQSTTAEGLKDKPVETPAKVTQQTADGKPVESEKTVSKPDRAEFKQFVQAFGQAKAAEYFAEGLSLSDADKKWNQSVQVDRDALALKVKELESKLASKQASAPAPFDGSNGGNESDLWKQYRQMSDPAEKT